MGWPPALRELKDRLYEVYLAASAPSLDEITGDIRALDGLNAAPSRDAVHRIITNGEQPRQQADVVAVATVLARRALWDTPALVGRVVELWERAQNARPAGRPVDDFRGDVRLVLDGGLGVHPVLDIDSAHNRFGTLPAYVPRDHDARLKTVVDEAKAGRSGIAVLVGGSSTGKTRALWEAVHALPDGWHLWHPLSPTAPDAVLAELQDIAPKTVVWLNEAQHYLGPDPVLGERVSAGLRQLLHDPSRAPVLVLGTLWPERWDTLTTSDRHDGARALLSGHKIDVPDAFTPAHLAALDTADDADPRLTQALQRADDAQITQYLAGAPVLMERYNAARGATLALIHAAMDARRLGASPHIPLHWLADAASGYLTNFEYDTLDSDWLSKALAYVTTPCNGIPGILTPVNTNGPRNQRTRRPTASGIPADRPTPGPQGPRYLLADYLDQYGRHHRAQTIPPIDFWTAAARHAHPIDMTALGDAAWDRGLYRDAAQLHKHAITYGYTRAAGILVNHLRTLHPTDHHPAQWAVAHVVLDDAYAVLWLLEELRRAGAGEQTRELLARDPAAHVNVTLDDSSGVNRLLEELRKAGADKQATSLAERAVAHIALDTPLRVALQLEDLRGAGADEQATTLAKGAAVRVTPDDSFTVTLLLKVLHEAGADEQATTLAKRAAAHVSLDAPSPISRLLKGLREVGANEQACELLARDPAAHVTVDDPARVARLLKELRKARANEQATTLAKRAVTHVVLDDPFAVGWLLKELRSAGAGEQARELLARDPAAHVNVTLDDPSDVAWLLEELREAGADKQTTTLAERAAAHYGFDDPSDVALLLEDLGGAWVADDPTARAEHVTLDDPSDVAWLLEELRKAGAGEQARELLARDPAAHVTLDDPSDVARLLKELRKAGAGEQARKLLARDPATHVNITLDDSFGVTRLLEELRKAGADEQATNLAERLPALGYFSLFIDHGGNREQFRLGREPDGSAAPSWTWNELD